MPLKGCPSELHSVRKTYAQYSHSLFQYGSEYLQQDQPGLQSLGILLPEDGSVVIVLVEFLGKVIGVVGDDSRREIRGSILQEAAPEKLLILSSHLVEEMEAIADRAIFIREGKLVEVRDLEEMRMTDHVSMADRYRAIYGHVEVV